MNRLSAPIFRADCFATPGEKYCGQACKEAGSKDVVIARQCDRGMCPLTV